MAGEQPGSEKDQDQGPVALESELHHAQGVQQKQDSQRNQHYGTRRHLGRLHPFSSAKRLPQSKRIGHWLPHLDRFGRTNRVYDLVEVKEAHGNAEESIPSAAVLQRIY